MKLAFDFNLYYIFEFLFLGATGISGLLAPHKILLLFNVPPTLYKHEEINEFINAFAHLFSTTQGVLNIAQALSFLLAFFGTTDTKRTVCKINALINITLALCFWYNIHYVYNPHDDVSRHTLFVEEGVSSIWFQNMWLVTDSALLLWFGVFKPNIQAVISKKKQK